MENKIKPLIKKFIGLGNARTEKQSHIDPVCGMAVTTDSFKADYKGKSYYFCSDYCRGQFLANPANFAN